MSAAVGIALANYVGDRPTPSIHVADRAIAYRIATDFAQNGQIAGNHGNTTGERLDDWKSEAFRLRWQNDNVRPSISCGENATVQKRENRDRIGYAKLLSELLILLRQPTPNADQPRIAEVRAHRRKDSEQQIDSLARLHTPDVQYFNRVSGTSSEKSANLGVGVGIRGRSKNRVHSVMNHFQALAGDNSAPDNLVANRAAIAVHPGGLTEAAEDSPRHRTKRPRAVLDVRLQQAPERIEIVARDDASIGRQMMNQMTVAVIDDMKNIEARSVARDPSRVSHEPVK